MTNSINIVILAISLIGLAVSIPGDDISGDYLENWNIHPLTYDIPLRDDPVQSVHFTLIDHFNVNVTWLTPVAFANNSFNPACYYGTLPSTLIYVGHGKAYTYTAGMFDLTLNQAMIYLESFKVIYDIKIYYVCGDHKYGWSPVTYFILRSPNVINPLPKEGLVNQKYIALIADMGVTNDGDTVASIMKRIDNGQIQMVVHAGDISYADNFDKKSHNNSYIWTEYMYGIQNVTSRVPYMTAPGNHEAQFKFAAYLNWLQMPVPKNATTTAFWYSFDYMGVHFTAYSSEHDVSVGSEQRDWIIGDLTTAANNRRNVPWLLIFAHRPLYCTAPHSSRCEKEAPVFRRDLEDLLLNFKVDVHLSGHNHQYERTFPVYKLKAQAFNYIDPIATTYIVNGKAGCPEPNDAKFETNIPWRAFMDPTINNSYMIMAATNETLNFQYIESKTDLVIDEFTIVKTK